MKRVYIIHGWGGYPAECWFPWLSVELEKRGIQVEVPQMPNADTPRIDEWVSHLEKLIGTPDKETYLVGHSIGVQTVLRYVERAGSTVGGVLAVAGFFTLSDEAFDDEEDREIAKPWLETPIDNEKVKANAARITAIFSDDDPYVPLENVEYFAQRLDAKTITEKGKGHLGGSDNAFKEPKILEELLKLMD